MPKRTVLITAPHLSSHGGGELLVLNFFEYLSKKNQTELWAWRYDKEKTFQEFKKLGSKLKVIGKETSYFNKLRTWSNLDCSKFDSVLAGGFPSYFCAKRHKNVVAKIMIIPAYVKNPLLFPLRLLDGMMLKKCKKVVVDCQTMQDKVKRTYGCDSIVIAPGINLGLYKEGKFEDYFLHVSRLDREKSVDLLINEWNIDSKLLIVGSGDSTYENELKRLAKGKNIEFLGAKNKKELAKYYSNCCGVLLAAHDEPFGIVLLEGLASGKPLIAINKGGPKDIVKEDFGFLCENHAEIVEKAKMLANNKKLVKKMGKMAHKESKKYALKDYLARIEKELLN